MKEIIKEASRLLEENRQEWEPRYKRYIEDIATAEKNIRKPNSGSLKICGCTIA